MLRRHTLLAAPGLLALPAIAATPERETLIQGFSPARLARIAPAMAREIERQTFAGAITCISRHGRIVHMAAHGTLDPERRRPMGNDAIFMLASMTKPLIAALAMTLVEEGLISLRDPIGRHLPELRELKVEQREPGRPVQDVAPISPPTVQDLLRHTAGFFYSGPAAPSQRLSQMYDAADIEQKRGPLTTDEFLRRLATIPLGHQPGTTFHYSICIDVLGVLCQRVTGIRLDRLLKQRILDPLGMLETGWFISPERMPRLAMGLPSDPQVATMWASYRIEQDPGDASYFKGGAGLAGTTADWLKFAEMMLHGGLGNGQRILSPATVRFMLSDHTLGMEGTTFASTGPGYGMGLGFAVRRQEGMAFTAGSVGDAMWAGAWGTSFTIDHELGVVGLLMSNGPSTRVHSRMLFKNLLYGALVA